MLDAEEAEAKDEEERIAGQADEGGDDVSGDGSAVDAVEHPVFGDVAVDEGVAFDFRVSVDEPQAQSGSGGEGERDEPPSSESCAGHWVLSEGLIVKGGWHFSHWARESRRRVLLQ